MEQDVAAGNVEKLLEQARAASEDDNSIEACRYAAEALKIDGANERALEVLGRLAGWDSKQCVLDAEVAVEAARRYLGTMPEGARRKVVSDLYTERKRQVALMIEAQMMLPSYTGAKRMHHAIMQWKRLLEGIPCLSADLLESEIALCHNLCARSKAGIMPGDRLVHVSYSEFNGKESYDETFRKALAGRIAAEREREDALRTALVERVEARRATYRARKEEGLSPEAERELLESDLAFVIDERDALVGTTNKGLFERQIGELEGQLEKLKSYKLFHRRQALGQIANLRGEIAKIDAQLEPAIAPLEEAITAIRARLSELSQ